MAGQCTHRCINLQSAGNKDDSQQRKESTVATTYKKGNMTSHTAFVPTTFNPLGLKLILEIFKDFVRTAKKTQHFTITQTNWSTLLNELISVHSENHTKPKSTKRRVTDS
jgi:hypothetical protein